MTVWPKVKVEKKSSFWIHVLSNFRPTAKVWLYYWQSSQADFKTVTTMSENQHRGWGCSSVAEHFSSMWEVLGLICSTTKNNNKTTIAESQCNKNTKNFLKKKSLQILLSDVTNLSVAPTFEPSSLPGTHCSRTFQKQNVSHWFLNNADKEEGCCPLLLCGRDTNLFFYPWCLWKHVFLCIVQYKAISWGRVILKSLWVLRVTLHNLGSMRKANS